jgi:hypothetical protein
MLRIFVPAISSVEKGMWYADGAEIALPDGATCARTLKAWE